MGAKGGAVMQRSSVSLLVALLVAVTGSGTVAQSPSPSAAPSFGPSSLAAMLPRQLGDMELMIHTSTGPEVLSYESFFSWGYASDILDDLGKEACDLEVAGAFSADTSGPDRVSIIAVRVDAVPADVVQAVELWNIPNGFGVEGVDDSVRDGLVLYAVALWDGMEGAEGAEGAEELTALVPRMETIGDRRIFNHGTDHRGNWSFTYLADDVRFMVNGSDGIPMEEVLAELP